MSQSRIRRPGSSANRTSGHEALVRAVLDRLRWTLPPAQGHFWANATRAIYDERIGRWRKMRGDTGSADIVGVYLGRHVELEIKTGRATLQRNQREHAERVRTAGGHHIVIRAPEDVVPALAEVRRAVFGTPKGAA